MFKRLLQKWIAWRRGATDSAATRSASDTANAAQRQYSDRIDTIHASYSQVLFGVDTNNTETINLPEKLVGQAVEQQLRDSEQRRAAVPRLPTIIPMLLQQLRAPNASSRDYVAIIRQDPVVAAAVLKFANSAYFNPYRKAVDNFERAVTALGIKGLRLVLSTAVLQPIMQGRGDNLPQKVWDHSLACAICCQQLAEREQVDPFKAFLTGLVHDIGVVTIYNQLQLQSKDHLQGQRLSTTTLIQLVEQWAQPLAFWIAQDWQLPTDIVRALAAQSERGNAPKPALAQILMRANQFSEAYMLRCADQFEEEALIEFAASLQFPANIIETLDSAFTEGLTRK